MRQALGRVRRMTAATRMISLGEAILAVRQACAANRPTLRPSVFVLTGLAQPVLCDSHIWDTIGFASRYLTNSPARPCSSLGLVPWRERYGGAPLPTESPSDPC